MSGSTPSPAADWIDAVCVRPASMTQRKLATVERWLVGPSALVNAAHARGTHLLQPTDDRGETLIAASTSPFKVLT